MDARRHQLWHWLCLPGGNLTQTNADSNYSLPGVVTPNGDSNLATTVNYASSFAVTQVTAATGAASTTTYDSLGRPTQSTIPDGAQTNYTYVYYSDAGNSNHVNTQTATVANSTNPVTGVANPPRWKVTTVDGFGRVIQVDSGHDAVSLGNTASRVLTQYAPCACSPLGKLWRVSQPFNPNSGSAVWTTYAYDGAGRTLSVTAPDGVSATTYSYAGNKTTVTDPAGKWKTSTTDAFGNLTKVTEPDPAGGDDWLTTYTYTALNQLLTVSMPRSTGTQTRQFAYTGADMVSATNPENGTVIYTYDNAHRVLTRTDARSQQTQYAYDTYGRLSQVKHGIISGGIFTEYTDQQVNYGRDAYGRLTGVGFTASDLNFTRNFQYSYAYNPVGRVTSQTMSFTMAEPGSDPSWHTFTSQYQWDNEGRMASYTDLGNQPYSPGGQQYVYQYDAMGRLGGLSAGFCMVWVDGECYNYYDAFTANAVYGPAGEMTNLAYSQGNHSNNMTETRQYNSLLQVTRMTTTPGMDMQYTYPAQNNGRISKSMDWTVGEEVNYTYDSLNRLTEAHTTGAGWGDSYTYDGFGNLLGTNITKQGGITTNTPVDAATNRLSGVSYDANGNPTGDVYTANVWDVENRMVKQIAGGYGGVAYSYEPGGRRVMKNWNADPAGTNGGTGFTNGGLGGNATDTYEFYFYGITGQKMATIKCYYGDVGTGPYPICSMGPQNVYFGAKLVMTNQVLLATDRLGSVRKNSNGESFSYFPYGQERTATTDGREKFGTYFRDGVGQDYAEQRYYGADKGRFWNPDPAGLAGADPTDPGSWNRYSSVEGDPVNFNDPTGRLRQAICYPGTVVGLGMEGWFYTSIVGFVCDSSGGGTSAISAGPESAATTASPFPKCASTGSAKQLTFVAAHYAAASAAASAVESFMPILPDGTQEQANQANLAVAFLDWSGWESNYGTSTQATSHNNYFGYSGTLPSSMTWGQELYYILGATPNTPTNLDGVSYLSYLIAGLINNPNASPAAILQAIADGGYNSIDPNYGNTIAGPQGITNMQSMIDCLKANYASQL